MVVADGGMTTVACCIRRDRLDACRVASPRLRAGDAIEAFLRRECRGVDVVLRSASRDGPWLAAGPLNPGIRVSGGDGPFRIGNAAGEAHPIIGEGMSMALQSAWLLCSQLLSAEPNVRAFGAARQRDVGRRYAGAWRRQFGARLRLAAGFAHMAMRPAAGASLVVLARAWPAALTFGAHVVGKARSIADPAAMALLAASTTRVTVPHVARCSHHAHPSSVPKGHDMTTTLDRLRVLLVKDYELEPDSLTLDAPLASFGIDSLGVAELMFNIEDEFKVTIPGDPVSLPTVGDVVRYIDDLVAAQHRRDAPGGAAADRIMPAQ
jgi:acyl carrier protein